MTTVYVALDELSKDKARSMALARRLVEEVDGDFGFKINLDYIAEQGIERSVREIKDLGKPVFADMKMWNGRRTMADAARLLAQAGADILNAYVLADTQLDEALSVANDTGMQLFGVTVLTHYADDYCRSYFGRSLLETVRFLTLRAIDLKLHGVILPGTTLGEVQDLKTGKLCPGIRPKSYKDTRHEQAVTVEEAVEGGADIVVVGGPVARVNDPCEALRGILASIPK